MTVPMPPPGRSSASSRSSASASPKCMKRPPLHVPMAVRVGMPLSLYEATMVFDSVAPWAALVAALAVFLWLDLHFFARGREPRFREAVAWSIGWLVLSLAAALVVAAAEDGDAAVLYT